MTLPGLYKGALGLDIDAHGRLYIANTEAKQILRYDPRAGQVDTVCGVDLVKPTGIRVDSTSGVLFIADLHAFKAITVTKSLPPTPPTLNMDLANLLCQDAEDTFSDVTFLAEGREFMAHCAIIAQRCPKLKDAINHSDGKPVALEVSYKCLVSALFFLYTDRCIVDQTTQHDLLAFADRYDVCRLKCLVEEYMLKRVNLDNVLETLRTAHRCHADRLKKACIKIVIRHFAILQGKIPSSGLAELPELLTELILSMPK
uniref:BTB domain-containing protein n=1 Tax=Vitrella brassicaformis TaxID=1169539 RepID=A0A7S1K9Q5_9ALVE